MKPFPKFTLNEEIIPLLKQIIKEKDVKLQYAIGPFLFLQERSLCQPDRVQNPYMTATYGIDYEHTPVLALIKDAVYCMRLDNELVDYNYYSAFNNLSNRLKSRKFVTPNDFTDASGTIISTLTELLREVQSENNVVPNSHQSVNVNRLYTLEKNFERLDRMNLRSNNPFFFLRDAVRNGGEEGILSLVKELLTKNAELILHYLNKESQVILNDKFKRNFEDHYFSQQLMALLAPGNFNTSGILYLSSVYILCCFDSQEERLARIANLEKLYYIFRSEEMDVKLAMETLLQLPVPPQEIIDRHIDLCEKNYQSIRQAFKNFEEEGLFR